MIYSSITIVNHFIQEYGSSTKLKYIEQDCIDEQTS